MHCHNEFVDDRTVIDVDQRLQFRSREQRELHPGGGPSAGIVAEFCLLTKPKDR